MTIKLVSILVPDPLVAFKFYTEVLDFEKKMYVPEAHLAIVVSKDDPMGTAILLEPNQNLGAKEFQERIYNAGMPYMVFGVTDIYKEYELLKSKGVVFRGEPKKTEWGVQVSFEDTCGNLLQLHQD